MLQKFMKELLVVLKLQSHKRRFSYMKQMFGECLRTLDWDQLIFGDNICIKHKIGDEERSLRRIALKFDLQPNVE